MIEPGDEGGEAQPALVTVDPIMVTSGAHSDQWSVFSIESSCLLVKAMSAEYRIEPAGHQFTIIDAAGNQVGIYPTEETARQAMERRRKQDAMLETAKLLLENAVKAQMQIHGVDHDTALYWIRIASEVK